MSSLDRELVDKSHKSSEPSETNLNYGSTTQTNAAENIPSTAAASTVALYTISGAIAYGPEPGDTTPMGQNKTIKPPGP